jgi:hypothetical protein
MTDTYQALVDQGYTDEEIQQYFEMNEAGAEEDEMNEDME